MATTVHIPKPVLERVDERAKALNLSRNRFIVEALEKALAEQATWSPGFVDSVNKLTALEPLDDLLQVIRANRKSKGPPRL
jgi:Ribbon-helix-helix protein, copG family